MHIFKKKILYREKLVDNKDKNVYTEREGGERRERTHRFDTHKIRCVCNHHDAMNVFENQTGVFAVEFGMRNVPKLYASFDVGGFFKKLIKNTERKFYFFCWQNTHPHLTLLLLHNKHTHKKHYGSPQQTNTAKVISQRFLVDTLKIYKI